MLFFDKVMDNKIFCNIVFATVCGVVTGKDSVNLSADNMLTGSTTDAYRGDEREPQFAGEYNIYSKYFA